MRLTLRPEVADLMAMGFTISPIQHLYAGVRLPLAATAPLAAQRWWRSVRRNIPAAARPFLALANSHPRWEFELLAPALPPNAPNRPLSLEDELDALRSTDEGLVTEEFEFFAARGPLPRSISALADGKRELARLADSAHALYKATMADDWPAMYRRLRADVAERQAVLGSAGLAETLLGIHPGWHDPTALTLTIPHVPEHPHTTIALGGRGLSLSPSLFRTDRYTPIVNAWQRSTLIYPVQPDADRRPTSADGLAMLLGHGRAAALRQICDGCTTAELAARMGVSAPTASVHASTLRVAGLITTVRDGRRVVHSVTALGAQLLAANPTP